MTSPDGVVKSVVTTFDVGLMAYNVVCDVATSSKRPVPEAALADEVVMETGVNPTTHEAITRKKTARVDTNGEPLKYFTIALHPVSRRAVLMKRAPKRADVWNPRRRQGTCQTVNGMSSGSGPP
jgi:hypothetical protein